MHTHYSLGKSGGSEIFWHESGAITFTSFLSLFFFYPSFSVIKSEKNQTPTIIHEAAVLFLRSAPGPTSILGQEQLQIPDSLSLGSQDRTTLR